MKYITQLMLAILLGLLTQNCLASPQSNDLAPINENSYELNSVSHDDATFLNHSFYAAKSGQFLNISSKTHFDSKELAKPTTDIYISTNKGTIVISKQGVMTMVDGHNEFIGVGEKPLQKMVFQSLIGADLIEDMKQEIEDYTLSTKSGGACGAATTGAAHAVGQYASALFSGDFDGANFWYSVYQGHVYNMRIFCEIQ